MCKWISLYPNSSREKSGLKCEPYSRQLSQLRSSDLGSNFSTLQVKYVCRNSSNCKNPAGLLCCHLQCVFVGILSQSCLFGDLSSQKLICKGQITSDLLPEGRKSLLSTSGFQRKQESHFGEIWHEKGTNGKKFPSALESVEIWVPRPGGGSVLPPVKQEKLAPTVFYFASSNRWMPSQYRVPSSHSHITKATHLHRKPLLPIGFKNSL